MPDTLRTFLAVETSEDVKRRAAELIKTFSAVPAKVSWVKPHNMHLTVKFLADAPRSLIPKVTAAVQAAVASLPPFEVEICRAGAFPNVRRPQTLWLGTGDGSEPLESLHKAIEKALRPLGFPKELRRFSAHLTLGRLRGPSPVEWTTLLHQHADFAAGRFDVAEVVLFASQLTPQGPIYDVLSRAALAQPA